LATAGGSATWSTASQGQVTFTNVGWTSVNATGFADLSNAAGSTYSFISNVAGSLVIDYNITAQGTSATSTPLFGLNGFFIYAGQASFAWTDVYCTTGLNTNGAVELALAPGDTYWVRIQDSANIFGGVGTSDEHMNAAFEFSVQSDSGSDPIGPNGGQTSPEPASLVTMLIGLASIGVVAALGRTH